MPCSKHFEKRRECATAAGSLGSCMCFPPHGDRNLHVWQVFFRNCHDVTVACMQVETAGPQYNIFQTLFGASVHDANVNPPQDYTISYTCYFV